MHPPSGRLQAPRKILDSQILGRVIWLPVSCGAHANAVDEGALCLEMFIRTEDVSLSLGVGDAHPNEHLPRSDVGLQRILPATLPKHLNDAMLRRVLDSLYDYKVETTSTPAERRLVRR